MNSSSIFITAANRGIGLEFVKQLLRQTPPPKHIIATYRSADKAKELLELAGSNTVLHPVQFDVTDYAALPAVVKKVSDLVGSAGLNVLVNNAGYMDRSGLSSVTPEEMRSNFEINTIAPLVIIKAFLPLLKMAAGSVSGSQLSVSRAAILNITTKMASIAENGSGGMYSYRASKTAQNAISKSLSIDLRRDNIMCVALHPGWVQTAIGGGNALITTEMCVTGLLNVMKTLGEKNNGLMYDYKGALIPW